MQVQRKQKGGRIQEREVRGEYEIYFSRCLIHREDSCHKLTRLMDDLVNVKRESPDSRQT